MKHGYLYLLISISGASVLAIELLGTRILGPFYGVSLFLWSALITVTLAGLAIGYFVGGRLADRGATYPRLGSLLAISGVWLIAVPWIRSPLLRVTEPFGLRFAALLAALVLFFIPLMLLGMVSPYAIKLRTSRLEEVGRSAGNLYAISTLASVAAALLIGFFLIPSLGVYRLTTAVGVILLGVSLPAVLGKRRASSVAVMMAAVLIGGFALVASQHENAPDQARGIIFRGQSPYAEIRVVDEGTARYLLIDGGIHTAADTSWVWRSLLPYANVVDIARSFFAEPGRLLLVGLGGGSVAKSFSGAGWKVDAVEIDPLIVKLAYRYFGLDSADARVFRTDGRRFLRDTPDRYQVIVMDAFGSSSIPFHLLTREAFELAASRLTPDGVLVVNLQAIGWQHKLVRSAAATIGTQFREVLALPTMEPPDAFGNVLIFAANRPLETRGELPEPTDRFTAAYDRVHAWDNRFEPSAAGARFLTDDHNPVDIWAESISLADREDLHEFFSGKGVSW